MRRILAIIVLLFATRVSAQTLPDYYEGHTDISADGINFKVEYTELGNDKVKSIVSLYNENNILCDDTNLRYRNGTPLMTEEEYARIRVSTEQHIITRIIRDVFGDMRISMLRQYKYAPLTIFFAVAPDGTTLEVAFIMDGVALTLSIPPRQFALLEKKLKSTVKWQVNDFGSGLQFLHASGEVNFNNVPTSDELISIEKNDDALGADLVPIE